MDSASLRSLSLSPDAFRAGEYNHDFGFRSAYSRTEQKVWPLIAFFKKSRLIQMYLQCTTHHNSWITVDYIFFSAVYSPPLGKFVEGDLKLLER